MSSTLSSLCRCGTARVETPYPLLSRGSLSGVSALSFGVCVKRARPLTKKKKKSSGNAALLQLTCANKFLGNIYIVIEFLCLLSFRFKYLFFLLRFLENGELFCWVIFGCPLSRFLCDGVSSVSPVSGVGVDGGTAFPVATNPVCSTLGVRDFANDGPETPFQVLGDSPIWSFSTS